MAQRGYSLRASADQVIDELGVRKAARKGLFQAGSVLETTWKRTLKQPGTGKTYPADLTFITVNGRVVPVKREDVGMQDRTSAHTASAPGQPPASDSGELSASVGVRELPDGEKVRIGSGAPHAPWLEFGVDSHPGGITIAPRPHARPALTEATPAMNERMRKALSDVGVKLSGSFRAGAR